MSAEEVYELLERVRVYYQNMSRADTVYEIWYNVLKNYSYQEVCEGLEKYVSFKENRKRIPTPYDLIDDISSIKQKAEATNDFVIDCNLCHKNMTLSEYNRHYSKCSSISYLLLIFKKANKNVTRTELESLSDEDFEKVYEKYKQYEIKASSRPADLSSEVYKKI